MLRSRRIGMAAYMAQTGSMIVGRTLSLFCLTIRFGRSLFPKTGRATGDSHTNSRTKCSGSATLLVAAGVSLFARLAAHWRRCASASGFARIKPLTPFVMPSGAAYERVPASIIREFAPWPGLGTSYVDTIAEQLATVCASDADIAITGISITKARRRNRRLLCLLSAGFLQMLACRRRLALVSAAGYVAVHGVIARFTSIVGGLALVIIFVGNGSLNGGKADFPRSYLPASGKASGIPSLTLVTVGYGDRTAKSVPGRLLAILWMFISLFWSPIKPASHRN